MGGKIMVLKLNEFRDKLAGCWAGKNVGGVLGAPFECKGRAIEVAGVVLQQKNRARAALF